MYGGVDTVDRGKLMELIVWLFWLLIRSLTAKGSLQNKKKCEILR